MMSAIGMDEFVAYNRDQYSELAVEMAGDRLRRQDLRKSLRRIMLNSVLCKAPEFVENVEAAYLEMWARRCRAENMK